MDNLPPWISNNLRSSRSLKAWFRCWLASWVALIIMLPDPSLKQLGNAGFFAFLASFMVPANLPVQLFVFALGTLVLGLLLGWALGAAGMKAALTARNQLVLRQSLQQEAQSAAGLANPDALFMLDIFNGKFLDTASSVVYGVFLGFGCFIFALIRSYMPKLMIMSIYGTIALDVFCSYGPLFPFTEYTLVNSLLISVACYIAIGAVLIILVFPETVNHATLVATSGLITKLKSIVDIQQQILTATPEDLVEGAPLPGKLQVLRLGSLMQIQQMIGSLHFIGVEFSWGKWNADDVKSLQEPLTVAVNRAAALNSFVKLAGHRLAREPDSNTSAQTSSASDASDDVEAWQGDTRLLRQLRERHRTDEASYAVRMRDVLPTIEEATAELRGACSAGLGATVVVLDGINMRRWARGGAHESAQQLADLDAALDRLKTALAQFKTSKRLHLLRPFEAVMEAAPTAHGGLPLRSLYVSFVFAANIIVLADAIVKLMDLVQMTASKRTKNRLWAPGGLRQIAKALTSRGDATDQAAAAAGEDNVPEPDEEVKAEEKPYKLDPDSRPPTNFAQRFANRIHQVYKWTKTPEATFCFRYVIVSVALYIPAVARSSARLYYVEKGLWALIMAQLTLNVYASDQMYNYFTRIIGSFLGCVLGMLGWYIGSAKGKGNPYGIAAVNAVFLLPLVFLRLFAPPQYLGGVLLFGATFALVIGFSWIDGHLVIAENPGVGWDIAWKRFVTVMIGCAASFIIMMFPPKSGRKAVRLRNAATMSTLSYLYSDIMAAWISSGASQKGNNAELLPRLRHKFLGLAQQIQAVKMQTMVAKWEGSLRGAWPCDEYLKLAGVQADMMSSLALLAGSLSQVDPEMRVAFLHRTLVVNPNFIADVMGTFSIVAQALRTGEPIPQAFHQNLLDRLHYHGSVGRQTFRSEKETNESLRAMHMEQVSKYEYVFYATSICAVFQVIEGMNELRTITARLVGEVPLEGFARWREEYERTHEMK
ncbi:hypothetical protein PHLGIDRAFT_86838 [Phlebiopsis gigantea 11061_1 CR5-6]|uniref:ER transporter 6TM N-terminal domain-containing protein n=1 Tax=Phlebiopsis gigantea (strain 11061_1 CR5-6) TaxID=745531 RepID=A0A0C3NVJ2_PHLG1|nr:hypothetical protein PHLGIDRAFT_86838 [Phlebiopsis gigantea 11061_1 CR5-6]